MAAKARVHRLRMERAPLAALQEARRAYRALLRARRSSFLWHLERFRTSDPQQFWSYLKYHPPDPIPSLEEFLTHFSTLFGAGSSSELPGEVASALATALVAPFTVDEVSGALAAMRRGKSSGNAVFNVDLFRGVSATFLALVARVFTFFARAGYPRRLNTLLLMLLYKAKGDRACCDNYRGISLIHPLGRWFSKVVVSRLEADPGAVRARGQAGFRRAYRVEDNCLVL